MRAPSISSTTEPRVGRTMPMTHFKSVLLPLPLVPSSVTVSPWADGYRDAVQRPHRAVAGVDVFYVELTS